MMPTPSTTSHTRRDQKRQRFLNPAVYPFRRARTKCIKHMRIHPSLDVSFVY